MNKPTDWVLWANPKHPWHQRAELTRPNIAVEAPVWGPTGADLIFIMAMIFCLGMMAGAALTGILVWVML